jgi:hypothetical protein
MSFRRQSPKLSLSRRLYPGEQLDDLLAPRPARHEPLSGVKVGRVTVLGGNVAFTPLYASHVSGKPLAYSPQAVMTCLCGYADTPTVIGARRPARWHDHPLLEDGNCGFYAWKPDEQVPRTAGTWMLDVDLYGRVVEHERGYRAQRQRVLRISPIPAAFCEPPFSLSYDFADGHVTAACPACPPPPPDAPRHPVSTDRLRRLLNVEIDMERAWRLREHAPATGQ